MTRPPRLPDSDGHAHAEVNVNVNADTRADAMLREALRALPPTVQPAELDALNQRVLAQWQQRGGAHSADVNGNGSSATLGARLWQRRLWLGTAGLAAVAAVATAVLVTRPDPALEELMQPDVLSQMAIGEM